MVALSKKKGKKRKRGDKSSFKKEKKEANAGAITLLRKKYNENSVRSRGRERQGNYGEGGKTSR